MSTLLSTVLEYAFIGTLFGASLGFAIGVLIAFSTVGK
jgi:ABC-type nitrate/sulfonate/bicarbonate transport system permease component